jgi:hypothetical protein
MGAEWISLARARVCRPLLGAWAERQSWISGRLDGGFACWFAAFWATARMAASNWKMHWLEAAVVDSYYSAPRRRTVDGSRYAFTLLRFYAFASAFASRLICKPRGFRWTMDPRLSASTAELWQFHTIGSQRHGPRPHRQRKGPAHPSIHSVFSSGHDHDADTKRLNPAPKHQVYHLSITSLCGVSPALLPVSSLKG